MAREVSATRRDFLAGWSGEESARATGCGSAHPVVGCPVAPDAQGSIRWHAVRCRRSVSCFIMAYKLRKSVLGKHEVVFNCPACQTQLIAPLSDAGQEQACPACGAAHVVPGDEARQRLAEEALRRVEAKNRKALSARMRQAALRESEAAYAEAMVATEAADRHAALSEDQAVLRAADEVDRELWRSFSAWRRIVWWVLRLAKWAMMIGVAIMVLGLMILVGGWLVAAFQPASMRSSGAWQMQSLGSLTLVVGISVGLAGVWWYLIGALFGLLISIERNSRAILGLQSGAAGDEGRGRE